MSTSSSRSLRSFMLAALVTIVAATVLACVQALGIDGPITIKIPDEASTSGACVIPPGKVCSTAPQCGCPTSDDGGAQNCVVSNDGRNECIAAGSLGLNRRCTRDTECITGHSCVLGLCVQYCSKAADCPGGDDRWVCDALLAENPEKICLAKCDPLKPFLGCTLGDTCALFFTPSKSWVSLCTAANESTSKCSADGYCAPGYACIPPNDDCKKWCRVGGSDCGSDACSPFDLPHVYNGIEYGICP